MPARERSGALHSKALWWVLLVAGLGLRLWFLHHPMPHDDDTDVYAELGHNLFSHHIYGLEGDSTIDPTLIRLPGYPIFLGLIFSIFGTDNFTAVLLAQIAVDLLGCWLIASFVREHVSARAAAIALAFAALCPFTAGYSAIALTECFSIFAVSLALWSTGRMLRAQAEGRINRSAMLFVSAAMALAVLLRPDGALLAIAVSAAVLWNAWKHGMVRAGVRTVLVCGLLAALPLIPWTVRNWRTFHVIQPLAPRRVNDPGEYVNYGFYRWMSTWAVDIVSTGNVYWRVGTEPIDVRDLPDRAFDSPAQYAETAELLRQYNLGNTVTPALDAKFATLAAKRIHTHPLLCRVWVPILRVADMSLRPRTETLGLEADWWDLPGPLRKQAGLVVLGVLNIALAILALWGLVRRRVPWAVLPIVYILLRCALLSTMENSEPRYTVEWLPLLIVCAVCALTTFPRTPGDETGIQKNAADADAMAACRAKV